VEKITVRFGPVCVHYSVEESLKDVCSPVFRFFKSHFEICPGHEGEANFSFNVSAIESAPDSPFNNLKWFPILADPNSRNKVTLFDKRARQGATEFLFNTNEPNALLVFDRLRSQVHLYMSSEPSNGPPLFNCCKQLLWLTREIFAYLAVKRGAIILHASGVVVDGQAIAIVGPKGAGKSTILLKLIDRLNLSFLSGDKLFLFPNDHQLHVRGWPDYPHLGLGTIRQFPQLIRRLESRNYNLEGRDDKKIVIDPDLLRDAFGYSYARGTYPLLKLILPSISSNTEIVRISEYQQVPIDEVVANVEPSSSAGGWLNLECSPEEYNSGLNAASQLLRQCVAYKWEGKQDPTTSQLQAILGYSRFESS